MIFYSKLLDGAVKVKFSYAPEKFNISFYSVQLLEKSSNQQKYILQLPFNLKSEMVSAEFPSVVEGNYSVIVKAATEEIKDCSGAKTGTFLVRNSKLDMMLVLYICLIIIFTSCGFAFLKLYSHSVRFKCANRPRVLLLYSYDCSQHKDFVDAFINYLTSHCHLEVHTIYGNSGSPIKWLTEKYTNSDIIIFLISKGLFLTLDQKQIIPVQKGHHWWKQLIVAKNFIFDQRWNSYDDFKKKKICKICFPYSSKEHIPECLKNTAGKCYMLPKEMNRLLCFIHNYRPMIPCLNFYPPLSGSSFQSSPEGKALLEKLEAVHTAMENNLNEETEDVQTEIENNSHTQSINIPDETLKNIAACNSLRSIEEIRFCPTSESMSSLGSEENSNSYVKEFLFNQILKDSPGGIYQEFKTKDSSPDINQLFVEHEEIDPTLSCKFTNAYESSGEFLFDQILKDSPGENYPECEELVPTPKFTNAFESSDSDEEKEDIFLLNCLPENGSHSDDEDRFYKSFVNDLLQKSGKSAIRSTNCQGNNYFV